MSEGSPVGAHVIKMMGYIQTLEKLGFPLKDELVTDVILQSLLDCFKPFILNFNMKEINKTLPQLLGMLRNAESDLKKNGFKSILMVREANRKKKVKSKGNGNSKPKGNDALKPEKGISKEAKCFYYEKSGHWKRNCPLYLEEVKKAKANGASSSDQDGSCKDKKSSGRIVSFLILTVSLKSSKQNTTTDSTIQAEYIATSEAAKEVVWIKKFISELRVISSISDAIEFRCNDNGVIVQAMNPDLIEDPNTFLSASISCDEMCEYERTHSDDTCEDADNSDSGHRRTTPACSNGTVNQASEVSSGDDTGLRSHSEELSGPVVEAGDVRVI
ncbi:hypothetical protein V6N13_007872 [Hibiscus sabdariffa]